MKLWLNWFYSTQAKYLFNVTITYKEPYKGTDKKFEILLFQVHFFKSTSYKIMPNNYIKALQKKQQQQIHCV